MTAEPEKPNADRPTTPLPGQTDPPAPSAAAPPPSVAAPSSSAGPAPEAAPTAPGDAPPPEAGTTYAHQAPPPQYGPAGNPPPQYGPAGNPPPYGAAGPPPSGRRRWLRRPAGRSGLLIGVAALLAACLIGCGGALIGFAIGAHHDGGGISRFDDRGPGGFVPRERGDNRGPGGHRFTRPFDGGPGGRRQVPAPPAPSAPAAPSPAPTASPST